MSGSGPAPGTARSDRQSPLRSRDMRSWTAPGVIVFLAGLGAAAEGPGLESLWKDLQAEDAAVAYRAVRALGANPPGAVPFLRERLRPDAVEDARLNRLLADLGSPSFRVRESAQRELEKMGPLAEPRLRRELSNRPTLEVRRRVEHLLQLLDASPQPGPVRSPEQLRALRAVEALEEIGS